MQLRCRGAWGLAVALLAALPQVSLAEYAPPGELRDLMLIYAGEGRWSADDFRPYVTYLSPPPEQEPRDWFYDSFLVLQDGGAPSGAQYIDGKTDQADWEAFRRLVFSPDSHLHALDAAVAEAAVALGPPPRRVPVVVMIPYPHPGVTDFGDVDGDGVSEDLSRPEDRAKVIRWHVGAVIRDFAAAGLDRLELCGFYWMIEWVPRGDNDRAIRDAADAVHEAGLKLVWIPAYFTTDAARSRELGFDLSLLQPNYAFMSQQGSEPEAQRLCCAAQMARENGLGIEIELHPALTRDVAYRRNLLDYLTHGLPGRDGYMTAAPHAYYQGELTIKELCESPLPANRQLYDALYAFAKGAYHGDPPPNLALGRPARLVTQPVGPAEAAAGRLTDGRIAEADSGPVPAVEWTQAAAIDLDLGGIRPVGGLRIHYQTGAPSVAAPAWVSARVADSVEAGAWRPAGAEVRPRWEPSASDGSFYTGTVALDWPRQEARWIRAEVWPPAGAAVRLDEVEVLPATSLAAGRSCIVDPGPDAGDEEAAACLADGWYATGDSGDVIPLPGAFGQVTVDLDQTAYVGRVTVHLARRPAGPAPELEVRTAAGETDWTEWVAADGAAGGEWLQVALPPRDAAHVAVRLGRPADPLPVDEIEVLPPTNLALGRPYRVEPEWTASYPDDGRKLTDGLRTERGFGDGRAVGWYGRSANVTVDLGAVRPVDALRIGAEGGGHGAVFLPGRATVLAGTDGATWRLAGQTTFGRDEDVGKTVLGTLTIPLDGQPARYVRLELQGRGWLMIDEVEVISQGANAALGQRYAVSPPPTAKDKYADVTGHLLTDGRWGTPTFGEGATVGWSGEAPQVVIDFGREFQAHEVRVYALGGGAAAVWFPSEVRVSTATEDEPDGWRPAGSTQVHPPERGDETIGAFIAVPLTSAPFRYLRVEFEPHGWVMVGEIEVY